MDKTSCKESTKYIWSREGTKILIELYENFPCLYSVSSEDYYNKTKRTLALQSITNEYNKRNLTTLTPKCIKEKIHGLRTQYLGEVNKIKKSKVSGAGVDEIYKPKLWCFDMLQFISKGVPITKGESTLYSGESAYRSQEHAEDIMVEAETIYEGEVQGVDEIVISPIQSPKIISDEEFETSTDTSRTPSRLSANIPKKRKRSVSKEKESKIENLMETAVATLSSLNQPPKSDKNILFAQYLAAELNSIEDEEIVDDIKHQISNIVYEGKKQFREKRNVN